MFFWNWEYADTGGSRTVKYMDKNILAETSIGVLYGAGAAFCRNDIEALELLTDTNISHRVLWEGVIVITAQILKSEELEHLTIDAIPAAADKNLTEKVLQAATDWNIRDRESVHLAILGLSKSGFDPIFFGGTIIGSLWRIAAVGHGIDSVEYSKRLCLAAGMVTANS